jgi:hypothetical protein
MPKGGVALGVSYRMQSFSVDFYAEGKLIFTDTVEYGNKPNAPTPPIKAKDENYSYKFLCWDRAIEAVYEDTEYHAKYVKVAIHKEPEPEGPQITEGVKHIIVVIITVLVFCGAVILPVLTIITVKVILRLKMRDKKAKNT